MNDIGLLSIHNQKREFLMPAIKVGLNEWVVLDTTGHNDLSLWTDGLSGCVGVGVIIPPKIFVTHINSAFSAQDWTQSVEKPFLQAIQNMGSIKTAQDIVVVIGDDDETALSKAVLKTLVHLCYTNELDFDPSLFDSRTGLRIYQHSVSGSTNLMIQTLAQMGHKNEWGANQNSTNGTAVVAQGFFNGGSVADL